MPMSNPDHDRLALALESAKMGWWDLDWVSRRTIWSPSHEIIFGYEPGQPERDYFDWERRVHPDDLERIHQATHYARDHRENLAIQYRIIWPDGSLHWVNALGRFDYDSDGHPVRMLGVLTDITDLKQNEETLRRSEEFNRRVMDSSEDCIKILDLQGRLLYMNDPGQRLMEIDEFDACLYADWASFWDSASRPEVYKAIETAKQGGVAKFQGLCPTHKGTHKWWEALVTPIFNAERKTEQLLAISRDVTDRWHSERVFRESEERFRATFEQAAVGIAHVGLDGRWLRVNQKLCDIVGYSSEELLQTSFQDITYPEDLEIDLANVQQLLANEIQTYSMEKRYINKQGFLVWAELTVSLVRDASLEYGSVTSKLGAPKYFISVVEEIGDRKRIEAERTQAQSDLKERARELSEVNLQLVQAATLLERRNHELDEFVHVVSHDLKAPLRAISNLSEWIEMDLEGQLSPDNQIQLQLLRTRTQRMATMIDSLLDYSRVGRAEIATETVEVAALLAEVIDTLDPPPSFTIQIAPHMPTLNTKRLLLSQVFANLISNAIKHRDRPEGTLEISVQAEGKFYEFALKDDGPGIASEDRDKIFTIFQTLKQSENNESTGVGLSIVQKIVETEGGRIRLDSQLGEGATFFFTWPQETS
jgi:PAS domain S-box-containing protein